MGSHALKPIVKILNLFVFRRIVYYKTQLTEESILLGIEQFTQTNRNIEGEVYTNGFELHYISDFFLSFPTKLPMIEIIGKTKTVEQTTILKIKISLNSIMKIIYAIAAISIITFYLLENSSGADFGGIGDSAAPLMVVPIGYVLLLITYLFESKACSHDVERMIGIVEANSDNHEY